MIALLYLFDLYIYLVLPLYGIIANPVIRGVDMLVLAHLVEEKTLFLLHLPEQGKIDGSLRRSQPRIGGNVLLHLSLKLLRIKGCPPCAAAPRVNRLSTNNMPSLRIILFLIISIICNIGIHILVVEHGIVYHSCMSLSEK